MARPKNANQSKKIEPTIPADAYRRLEKLAQFGLYGSTPSEVARYLLIRGLDDMIRAGVLAATSEDKAA